MTDLKSGNIIFDRIRELSIKFSDDDIVALDQITDCDMSIRKDDKSMIRIKNAFYNMYLAEKLYSGLDVKEISITFMNVDILDCNNVRTDTLKFSCDMIVSTYEIHMGRDNQDMSMILIGKIDSQK